MSKETLAQLPLVKAGLTPIAIGGGALAQLVKFRAMMYDVRRQNRQQVRTSAKWLEIA